MLPPSLTKRVGLRRRIDEDDLSETPYNREERLSGDFKTQEEFRGFTGNLPLESEGDEFLQRYDSKQSNQSAQQQKYQKKFKLSNPFEYYESHSFKKTKTLLRLREGIGKKLVQAKISKKFEFKEINYLQYPQDDISMEQPRTWKKGISRRSWVWYIWDPICCYVFVAEQILIAYR